VQWENNYNYALLEELSAQVTSSAIITTSTFPNVTVTHFEIEAGYVIGLGGMIACAYAPFIVDKERSLWEAYAFDNHEQWVHESHLLEIIHPSHINPLQGTKDDEGTHETAFQGEHGVESELVEGFDEYEGKRNYSTSIYEWNDGIITPREGQVSTVYAPIWQVTPAVPLAINVDLFSSNIFLLIYMNL
jgi:hypothetical protein